MRTSEPLQPHDIIDFSGFTKLGIQQKAVELYASGRSLRTIARELDASKTSIRDTLIEAGVALRAHSNCQVTRKNSPRAKSPRTAPYGYCLINGQLIEDPKEQVVLKLILKWRDQGQSQCAIARRLNIQKVKPRVAKEWSQPTIGFILKRHQT